MGDAYHEEWLEGGSEVTVEEALAYEAGAVVLDRANATARLLRLLRAGRESNNPGLRSKHAMRLRRGYMALFASIRSFEQRFGYDWDMPEWEKVDDVPMRPWPRGVEEWSLEEFARTALPEARERARAHAAVVDAFVNASPTELRGVPRRKIKKELNSVMALLGKEVTYLEWALRAEKERG